MGRELWVTNRNARDDVMDIVRRLCDMENGEKIECIKSMLRRKGFAVEKRKGRQGGSNQIYTKEDMDKVLVIVSSKKQGAVVLVLLDKEFYDKELVGNKRRIVLKSRNDGCFVPCLRKKGKLVPIHRLVMEVKGGEWVDHKTHSLSLCLREDLRICTPKENRYNGRKSVNMAHKGRYYFRRTVEVNEYLAKESYISKGYQFERMGLSYEVDSPKFLTVNEMYAELNEFENCFFGEFRYHPLQDFSKTWYLRILQDMLGMLSSEDVEVLQKEYIRSTAPEIAERYGLLN